jgi:hypothetical protein
LTHHDSNPLITNNTVIHNTAGQRGAGIRSNYQSVPTIRNTIVWANNAPVSPEIYGDLDISYCDILGGYEGEGNIDEFPQFIFPVDGNFAVCAQSPCIDAGDPDILDPDGTRSDIGVFYANPPQCISEILYVSTIRPNVHLEATISMRLTHEPMISSSNNHGSLNGRAPCEVLREKLSA